MTDLRRDLQKIFSGINYSMIGLGLIPRSAPIEITLSGSDLNQVMQTGKI
jgi:HAE1 family hydrophobic/amphiphilic exporter-1